MKLFKTNEEKITACQNKIMKIRKEINDSHDAQTAGDMKEVFKLLFSIYMRMPSNGWVGSALRIILGTGIGIACMTVGPEVVKILAGLF